MLKDTGISHTLTGALGGVCVKSPPVPVGDCPEGIGRMAKEVGQRATSTT